MAGPGTLSHLRTDDFTSLMFSKFQQMRDEKTHTDFTLCIDNTKLPCHKIVLSVHSPFLDALMNTNMKEAAAQKAELKDINLDTMKIVMDYMYTGNISMDSEQLPDLLAASHLLQIDALTAWCIEQVPDILTPENVLLWNELRKKYEINEIHQCCIKMIAKKIAYISQQPIFLEMSYASIVKDLTDVLEQDVLYDCVLRAALRWIDHDTGTRLMHVAKLLDETLLRKCSSRCLLEVMITHGSLFRSSEEAYKLISEAALQKATQGQMLIIVGGKIEETVSHLCWSLDHVSGQMVEMCSIPNKDLPKNHSVCTIEEGFAITGGELCLLFNAASKSWSQAQNMQEERYFHGSVCANKLIYVLGGKISDQDVNSVQFLNLVNDTWQHGPDLPITVMLPGVAEIDKQVYVLDTFGTKELLKIDLDGEKWVKCANLPSTRAANGCSMLAVNGQLLVAGGLKKLCAWYKPETDTWAMDHHEPLSLHNFGSCVLFDNRVLLLGGYWNNNGTDDVEELSLEDGSWSPVGWKMPARLAIHQALVLDVPK